MLAPSVRFYVDLLGSWAVFHVWSSSRCQWVWTSLVFLFLTFLLRDGLPKCSALREILQISILTLQLPALSLSQARPHLASSNVSKMSFVTSRAPAPGKQMWLSILWLQFSNESKKSHWFQFVQLYLVVRSDHFQGLYTSELKLEIS